jgi:hypothetical protein
MYSVGTKTQSNPMSLLEGIESKWRLLVSSDCTETEVNTFSQIHP